jgi:hypothetical protein
MGREGESGFPGRKPEQGADRGLEGVCEIAGHSRSFAQRLCCFTIDSCLRVFHQNVEMRCPEWLPRQHVSRLEEPRVQRLLT